MIQKNQIPSRSGRKTMEKSKYCSFWTSVCHCDFCYLIFGLFSSATSARSAVKNHSGFLI